ncbi:hypothetical protein BJX70DRAFT_353485 [Aspergillus crustosus]
MNHAGGCRSANGSRPLILPSCFFFLVPTDVSTAWVDVSHAHSHEIYYFPTRTWHNRMLCARALSCIIELRYKSGSWRNVGVLDDGIALCRLP